MRILRLSSWLSWKLREMEFVVGLGLYIPELFFFISIRHLVVEIFNVKVWEINNFCFFNFICFFQHYQGFCLTASLHHRHYFAGLDAWQHPQCPYFRVENSDAYVLIWSSQFHDNYQMNLVFESQWKCTKNLRENRALNERYFYTWHILKISS